MNNQNGVLSGLEFMGNNIRNDLKYCGEGVVLYSLCKMIRACNAEIDSFTRILDFSFIDAGKGLKIGKHSMITWHTLIEGGGYTTIGDRVFIGPGTKLLTSTYEFDGYYAAEFIPQECRAFKYGDITIENDAYIGANSVVMPGVHIGEGALVGANSLVTKDLEPWSVYVGSPCKKMRDRIKPSEEMTKVLTEKVDWSAPHLPYENAEKCINISTSSSERGGVTERICLLLFLVLYYRYCVFIKTIILFGYYNVGGRNSI